MSRGGSLELLTYGLDGRGTGRRDGSGAAEVGVDACKQLPVVGLDVLDDNASGNRILAVSTRTVELTEVLRSQSQLIKQQRRERTRYRLRRGRLTITVKPSMVTVPFPLCCMTLSSAP